jgi:serine/threonine-protein kinase
MTAAADRHLLFGLLALQNGLIDQGALVAAFQAWTREKSKSLADHLEARGDLTAAKRALLDALAEVHVEAHEDDVEKSLAAVRVNRSTRASLRTLGEPEIEASLAWVARSRDGQATQADDDPDRTSSLSVGAATSDGQRFRLLRPHAQGGLGEVFVALDAELHREVALKQILEKHADDPESRHRFVAEAEITGGLEHPGVVPVYGLGTYADGRPYYAMRFVNGENLKEAIEHFHRDDTLNNNPGRRSLELRKLLRRFLDVCNAVDYAHSRGVIHRDLKPANIILGRHGETLAVDWGLAKAIGRADPSVGEQTIAPSSSGSSETLPGSALGTPAYMSPEQAGGDLDRLSPRSDVYSLGATLYCLLTGRPPFVGEDVGEVLRRVQAGDFRAPREIDPSLDEALDAVCKKAMATKPEDRYASCRALADDVERWMADEPVSAWREPLSRRAQRWARRNRPLVTAAVAAVLVALVGTAAVLAVQTQANAELTRSRAAVQARYDLAVAAIQTFHTGVSEDFLLKQEPFKELRERLLKSGSDFYGKLGALLGKETDVISRRALAQSNFELAELTDKVGRKEAALGAHRAVLAAREAMAAEPGAGSLAKVDVGRSLTAVARLLEMTGKTDEALAAYRRSESLLAGLAGSELAARAALADCRSKLGEILTYTGRADDALAVYRLARAAQEALAAGPGASNDARRNLADTVQGTALLLSRIGNSVAAEAEHRTAMAIRQKLVDDNPAVTDFRHSLAKSHYYLGTLLWQTRRQVEADAEYHAAMAIWQKLVGDNPAVTNFRHALAHSHSIVGSLLRERGKPAEAETEFHTAMEIWQKLTDDDPADSDFGHSMAFCHSSLGRLLSQTGKPAEAEAEYRKALAIHQKLADDNPADTNVRYSLAFVHNWLGNLFLATGKPAEAEAEYRKALATHRKLADDDPKVPRYRLGMAWALTNVADAVRSLGRAAEACDGYDWAIVLQEQLAPEDRTTPGFENLLPWSLRHRGLARRDLGDNAGAAADARLALGLYDALPHRDGDDWFETACCHAALCGLSGHEGAGVSAAERENEAPRAIAALSKAAGMGHRELHAWRTDSALDPLRSRDDFRVLMMDVSFPAEPFATPR